MPTQAEINQLADCVKKSDAESRCTYDPLCGCYSFKGRNALKLKECLINQYGWKALSPLVGGSGPLQPPSIYPYGPEISAPFSIDGKKANTSAEDKEDRKETPSSLFFEH